MILEDTIKIKLDEAAEIFRNQGINCFADHKNNCVTVSQNTQGSSLQIISPDDKNVDWETKEVNPTMHIHGADKSCIVEIPTVKYTFGFVIKVNDRLIRACPDKSIWTYEFTDYYDKPDSGIIENVYCNEFDGELSFEIQLNNGSSFYHIYKDNCDFEIMLILKEYINEINQHTSKIIEVSHWSKEIKPKELYQPFKNYPLLNGFVK